MLIKHLVTRYVLSARNFCSGTAENVALKMSGDKGKSLAEIVAFLEKFAPLKYAEDWDNVGLLVEASSDAPVKNILLTNDLTESVMSEAIELQTNLIISYHPNIFQGMKSVTSRTWKERIVLSCIKNNISVFSPHTSWDAVRGGVNDWLAAAFSYSDCRPIKENREQPGVGCGRFLTLNDKITVKYAVEKVKAHTGLQHVRLAVAQGKNLFDSVSTVAVCAGSGASVLNGVTADLYLTGEMLHHDVLDANHRNVHVILCNHSDSERGFLGEFKGVLNEALGDEVEVYISKNDRDPLRTA